MKKYIAVKKRRLTPEKLKPIKRLKEKDLIDDVTESSKEKIQKILKKIYEWNWKEIRVFKESLDELFLSLEKASMEKNQNEYQNLKIEISTGSIKYEVPSWCIFYKAAICSGAILREYIVLCKVKDVIRKIIHIDIKSREAYLDFAISMSLETHTLGAALRNQFKSKDVFRKINEEIKKSDGEKRIKWILILLEEEVLRSSQDKKDIELEFLKAYRELKNDEERKQVVNQISADTFSKLANKTFLNIEREYVEDAITKGFLEKMWKGSYIYEIGHRHGYEWFEKTEIIRMLLNPDTGRIGLKTMIAMLNRSKKRKEMTSEEMIISNKFKFINQNDPRVKMRNEKVIKIINELITDNELYAERVIEKLNPMLLEFNSFEISKEYPEFLELMEKIRREFPDKL